MSDIEPKVFKEISKLAEQINALTETGIAHIEACSGGAISGKKWEIGINRDEIFNAEKCRKTARERAKQGFGGEKMTICGKCIEVCPYTQLYINLNKKSS